MPLSANNIFTLLHQTPTRFRMKVSAPLTSSVQRWLQEKIVEVSTSARCQWYPLTRTFVVYHDSACQADLLKALADLGVSQLKKDYLEAQPPVPETAYETLRRALVNRMIYKLCLPQPIRRLWTAYRGFLYLVEGLRHLYRKRLTVEVLDAAAISVSILRGEWDAASSIQFLRSLSDRLEANTLQSSHHQLKESLALSIDRVWLVEGDQRRQVRAESIDIGDRVIITKGNLIPFDGQVVEGEGAVNEASLSGESFPIHKEKGQDLWADTVLEEGELIMEVSHIQAETAIAKLVDLITQSESLKSSDQKRLERTANRLVAFNFIGLGLTYLLTRNINKALSFLLVDFS